MFLQSVGVEAVNGRRCLFTQCRMLKLSPPVLLPTPMCEFHFTTSSHETYHAQTPSPYVIQLFILCVPAVILLRLHDALEGFLVQDVFLMMHELFAGRFVDPHIHIHNQQSTSKCVSTHGCAGSDQVALPDNSEVDSLHYNIHKQFYVPCQRTCLHLQSNTLRS